MKPINRIIVAILSIISLGGCAGAGTPNQDTNTLTDARIDNSSPVDVAPEFRSDLGFQEDAVTGTDHREPEKDTPEQDSESRDTNQSGDSDSYSHPDLEADSYPDLEVEDGIEEELLVQPEVVEDTLAPECQSIEDCAELEDSDKCNGTLICDTGTCVVDIQTIVDCSGVASGPCESVACSPDTGTCRTAPKEDGTECDDGLSCTEDDQCLSGLCLGVEVCTAECGNGLCEEEESCTSCEQDCGQCQTSCCTAHPQPGCGDEVVSECVCDLVPECCTDTWNEPCALIAETCGSCSGECCQIHDSPGCDGLDVEACVCETLPECCTDEWSAKCTAQAETCGAGCTLAPGCESSEVAGCSDCACEACVCDLDPYCCETEWDIICVSYCAEECASCN